MKSTRSPLSYARIALAFCVAVGALLAVTSAAPPAGSPNLYYNQPFRIWSDYWGAYCMIQSVGFQLAIRCTDTQPGYAVHFVIGGGCGPIASDANLRVRFSMQYTAPNYYWCSVSETTGDLRAYCNYNTVDPPYGSQWSISNIVQQPDGMLHGNSTAVRIYNAANGANGFCSANPLTQSNGLLECNRASVGPQETFYLVPTE
jgi:hypothetical protein